MVKRGDLNRERRAVQKNGAGEEHVCVDDGQPSAVCISPAHEVVVHAATDEHGHGSAPVNKNGATKRMCFLCCARGNFQADAGRGRLSGG